MALDPSNSRNLEQLALKGLMSGDRYFNAKQTLIIWCAVGEDKTTGIKLKLKNTKIALQSKVMIKCYQLLTTLKGIETHISTKLHQFPISTFSVIV